MTKAISISSLSKRFGALQAVSNLDLQVGQGEAFCLLGPNGAGKSTTINMILGLSAPDSGKVEIFGNDPRSTTARIAMGYTAQDTDFPPTLRVGEVLEMVRCHYPAPRSQTELLADFGLTALQNQFTGGLSGGQRRRLGLAVAFAGNGHLVVLDEPTTGLDSTARRAFWAYAQAYVDRGGTLLITTHHLDEIETIANRICLIDHGSVQLEGTVAELKQRLGQKYIRFSCSHLPDLSPVAEIHKTGDSYEIMSPDADAIIRQLVESGVDFHDLEIRSASLEDAIEKLGANGMGK